MQSDYFTANAQYVRITVTGLPSGANASFYDFKVFGNPSLFHVDQSDVIRNVTSITNLIDSTSGRTAAQTLQQVNTLFDSDANSGSDFRLNGSGSGELHYF